MNTAEFKFANNYTIAGSTCIIYSFLKESVEHGFGGIDAIGVKYKKTSESTWNEIIVHDLEAHTELGQYMISPGRINVYGYEDCPEYLSYIENYPIYFVIFGLDVDTEYDVCGYYRQTGHEYTINQCTVKTKSRAGTFNYTVIKNTAANPDLSLQYLQQHMEKVSLMVAPMIDFDMNFNVEIKKGYGAASWGGTLAILPSPDSTRDVPIIIHELAHGYFNTNGPNLYDSEDEETNSDIIKYMEFCTHVPKALYNWLGGHNYPCISSALFSDVENMFIISRFKQR